MVVIRKILNNTRLIISSPKKFLIKISKISLINYLLFLDKLRGKKIVFFEIKISAQFCYIESIWRKIRNESKISIYFSVLSSHKSNPRQFLLQQGIKKNRIFDDSMRPHYFLADLLICPTEFIASVPRGNQKYIYLPHGLAKKGGVVLIRNVLNFDIIFLTGPFLKEMYLNEFLKKHPGAKRQEIYEIGYPKLDALINRDYNPQEIKKRLNLDKILKPVILYAPAWEEGTSLRKYGLEIIETLLKMDVILLVKLHPMSYSDPKNIAATGGVDWRKELEKYEKFENFRNILDWNSNPYLCISDVLITDISGIAFEFMFLDRPIIYFDAPEFFNKTLPNLFKIKDEGPSCNDFRTDIVRNTGTVIKKPDELPMAVEEALRNPKAKSPHRKLLMEKLIYNPGKATQEAVRVINKLLDLEI